MKKILKRKHWVYTAKPIFPRRPIEPKKTFIKSEYLDCQEEDDDSIFLKNIEIPIGFTYKDLEIRSEWSNNENKDKLKVCLNKIIHNPKYDIEYLQYNKDLVKFEKDVKLWNQEIIEWELWRQQHDNDVLKKQIADAKKFLKKIAVKKMKLNSNSYYSIGSSHSHCEDFALSRVVDNESAFAIVSDGCSGSKFTDFGSRIISQSTSNILKWYLPPEEHFRSKILETINDTRKKLELNSDSLDATLLYVCSTENDYEVRTYGDGGILKLKNNGDIEFTLIEYPSGGPLYLNYYLDDERFSRYKLQFGLQRKVYKYLITPSEYSLTTEVDLSGEPYIEYGENDYKVIAVTSDGIASFASHVNKTLEMQNIIPIVRSIMDFKSVKGQFIERRMNGFKNTYDKINVKHVDDFSIAGISFEKE